jgi:hypothetical protein
LIGSGLEREMKVAAMSRHRRLMVTIALCGMLFGAFTDVAKAECVCNATCGDCVSCPRQYQTNDACAACYKSTSAKDSVLCTFAGAMAPVPVPPAARSPAVRPRTGAPQLPSFPGLPGTRPDAIRPDFMSWPESPTVKKSLPEFNDIRAGASPEGPGSSATAGTLPGTRPDTLRPSSAATLWGTRPDPLQPSWASTMQPSAVWWVLPGTRPDQIQPTFDYLETIRQFEPDTGLFDTRPDSKQPAGTVEYRRPPGSLISR